MAAFESCEKFQQVASAMSSSLGASEQMQLSLSSAENWKISVVNIEKTFHIFMLTWHSIKHRALCTRMCLKSMKRQSSSSQRKLDAILRMLNSNIKREVKTIISLHLSLKRDDVTLQHKLYTVRITDFKWRSDITRQLDTVQSSNFIFDFESLTYRTLEQP